MEYPEKDKMHNQEKGNGAAKRIDIIDEGTGTILEPVDCHPAESDNCKVEYYDKPVRQYRFGEIPV